MARFVVDNRYTLTQQNLTSGSYKTITAFYTTSNQLTRGRCVALSVGAEGAPNASDCSIVYAVARYTTTTGTGNVVTPQPKDPAAAATRIVSRVNFTSEPALTTTTVQWSRALNQRASMQWNAPDLDAAIFWAATLDTGLAMVAQSSNFASTVLCGAEFEEIG